MKNREFSRLLEERTKNFALRILKLSSNLPNTCEARIIRNQISKSGTSIGANYRETNKSRSAADFRNKIAICESEANETTYWLEIIYELDLHPKEEYEALYSESKELLALFTAIGKNTRT